MLYRPITLVSERFISINEMMRSPALGVSSLSEDNKARLTWVRYKRQLMVFMEDIKIAKVELGLRLGLVTVFTTVPSVVALLNHWDIVAVQNMYGEGIASLYDLRQKNGPALFYAVERNTPEFARLFLNQVVDSDVVNTAGVTASKLVWDRAFAGRYGANGAAIVRKLFSGDDTMDDMGFITLHKIIPGSVYKDLRTVLEASADSVNTIDSGGRTPLHWAVLCNDESATQQLLNYGADSNVTDREGFVAIDHVRGPLVCTKPAESKSRSPQTFSSEQALRPAAGIEEECSS
ncbi:MAG: hypothetical protein Q9184_007206 [Pyrenodesmia sp. 2 TL-2023]